MSNVGSNDGEAVDRNAPVEHGGKRVDKRSDMIGAAAVSEQSQRFKASPEIAAKVEVISGENASFQEKRASVVVENNRFEVTLEEAVSIKIDVAIPECLAVVVHDNKFSPSCEASLSDSAEESTDRNRPDQRSNLHTLTGAG